MLPYSSKVVRQKDERIKTGLFVSDRIPGMESNDDANFRAMAMDIMEHEKEYEVLANLPGFKKDNVKISIHDNQLLIEANVESKSEEQEGTLYRCERYSGNYRRNLLLPDNADVAKISAKMEDGILRLSIPKREASPQKEIVIQ